MISPVIHHLDDTNDLLEYRLPESLDTTSDEFEMLWQLHPPEFHEIMMRGRRVKTPRWQQAYGRDYQYTGSRNNALPTPQLLQPFMDWAHNEVEPELNGLLLNWYDADRKHYIGKHRDSTTGLVHGKPIVTISLGGSRNFRMRPWKGQGFKDFEAVSGSVYVIPFSTNETWTHEVPHSKANTGRRISITLRVFEE